MLRGYVVNLARRAMARSGASALARDERPEVLYLRSFMVDRLRPAGERVNYEQLFVKSLTEFGPVIAISPPGKRLPPLGAAARLSVADEPDWQAAVVHHLARAGIVVFVCAWPSDGFRWELEQVVERVEPWRLLGLIPPADAKHDPYLGWAAPLSEEFPHGLPSRFDVALDTPHWLTFNRNWWPIVAPFRFRHGMAQPSASRFLSPDGNAPGRYHPRTMERLVQPPSGPGSPQVARPAAWYSDPTKRAGYRERYWDGVAWTRRVRIDGVPSLLPSGKSKPTKRKSKSTEL